LPHSHEHSGTSRPWHLLHEAPHMGHDILPQASARLNVLDGGPIDGFVGFFDTQFKGSPENPASMEVLLSTAPDATGATHWGQQVRFNCRHCALTFICVLRHVLTSSRCWTPP